MAERPSTFRASEGAGPALSAPQDDHGAPTDLLTVRVAVHAAVAHLRLSGELDLETAPGLASAVEKSLLGRPRIVVLDLREVSFCDCAGLGSLLRAYRRIADSGATFHLERASQVVLRLLHLTGTAPVLGLPSARPAARSEAVPEPAMAAVAGHQND
ncbi:STAS domain-containing protein [Kitasatospora mediocidica]|uniref:STAS domain-containing protein n=1 Tax=Kitasatospora mediocidica TaxID=58352 RepID=UPI00068CBA1C|nr:STAS domain-containing protein [Kitasatospora mediocidica]